ncbi:MAG: cytochrome c biogenesis protein CcsA [bacterium]|nr:cytochrome c biogenesis protein CcsA [bacterium]
MNPNLIGDLLVFLALCFNILAGLSYFMVARGNRSYEALAEKCFNWFVVFSTLMLAYLFYLFFSHDFRVQYVYEYSDRSLPFSYLLSSLWGGQEGTYVLWMFMSACFGYAIKNRSGQYSKYGMFVFSLVNLFFLALMIKLSPYALMDFYAEDGAGLNPLLQDPWMVVHPPVMFVGYAATAIPFAIAMSALLRNDYSSWIKRAFPWVGVSSVMLAAGNILGGYWAYKTLGWGGFWAWDPVENSSFIPWFISLALLHGMVIERRTGALRRTNLLMSAFLFILVVYGTFLTRSGVLADFSVHSFVDLGINIYLVLFLVFYTLFTLVLFLFRVRSIESKPLEYNFYTKELSLFAGMVLLFLFSIVVLFWTSLPILTTLTGEPRAADLATYNSFALPFGIVYAVFLMAAPFLNYNRFVPENWKKVVLPTTIVAAAVGLLLVFLMDAPILFAVVLTLFSAGVSAYMLKSDLRKSLLTGILGFVVTVVIAYLSGTRDYMYLLYFGSAAMLVVSNLACFLSYLPNRWQLSGGQLTHFGFGLMLIGILGSSGFSRNEKVVINRGEQKEAFGLSVSYLGMQDVIEKPHNRLILTYDEGDGPVEVNPELYYSARLDGIMRKPYVKKNLLNDIYFSPEQIQDLEGGEGLTLKRGEPKKVGDYTFTFQEYDMSSQESDQPTVSVIARVQVDYGEVSELIEPIKSTQTGKQGAREFVDFPYDFGPDKMYSATIAQILADQDAVSIHVPGLAESGPPDRLILDLSVKPLINFVWAGTTLIILGGLIVFYRRFRESVLA